MKKKLTQFRTTVVQILKLKNLTTPNHHLHLPDAFIQSDLQSTQDTTEQFRVNSLAPVEGLSLTAWMCWDLNS